VLPNLADADAATVARCLRDVVALSTLPALWAGAKSARIAESLAAALYTMLDADFVYVALVEPQGSTLASVAQTDRYETDPQLAAALGPALLSWARRHDPHELFRSTDPRREVPLRVTCRPLGHNAELGVLAAGFVAEELPSPLHHMLLDIGATQGTIGFTNARLVQSLRQGEERFRALVNASSYIVYRMSPDWAEMWELQGRDVIFDTTEPSRTWLQKYIHPDDQPQVMEVVSEAVRNKSPFELEHRVRRADGTLGWTLSRAVPLLDAAGEIVEWFGAASDVTARKRTEEELIRLNENLEQRIAERVQELTRSAERLYESERRFRLLVEAVTDYAIFMLDTDGKVVSWNPGAHRIKGYAADEIIGRHFSTFYTEHDRQAGLPARVLEQAARTGRCEIEGWRVRKDGSRFWGSVIVDAIRDPSGELLGFAKVTRDLTERRTAEEQFRQAQKMEAIGQLTGGIAHDFNNLLGVISGNLDMLQLRLQTQGGGDLLRLATLASRGAMRAAMLTHRLLAFARRQPLEPMALVVSDLITNMSEMLRRTLGETIAVETVLAAGLWHTFVDANQLESALLNLAVNARDAMPDGGRLTIETANVYFDEQYAAKEGISPGQYVGIFVSDTGIGMPPDVVAKAFDPFFTTKEVGHGTGLGLSQVYGFMKQSEGHAKIYSEVGAGTTIKLYLRRYYASESEAQTKAAEITIARGSDEAILVVDDDPDLRSTTVEMLRELGYRVVEAPDGASALRLLDAHRDLKLIFTDVGLPGGMNGRQLADEARRRRPDMKVLFTSGYARNAIVHHGRLDPGVELLVKPFTYAGLAARIRRFLDGQ
jgi:PAS domain S-box-containing protein